MRFFLLFLLLVTVYAFPSLAQNNNAPSVDTNVEIWLPPDFRKGDGPWPLVIFSHGFGGCAKQSAFLTSYIADQGYIVAAPDHADGHPCHSKISLGEGMPEKPFRFPEQWDEKTYKQRRDDILFTLKSLQDDPKFKGVIDTDNMALIGHSLGGYTVMAMAGAWPSWKDARFRAIIALSPYAAPFIAKGTLGSINVPVMYHGGTLDKGMTPLLKSKVYPDTASPKYYVELDGAGHDAWTDMQAKWQEPIKRTVLSFLNVTLRRGDQPVLPQKPDKGVSAYWSEVK